MEIVQQQLLNGLVHGVLLAFTACGYSVLYRQSRTLCLAFGAVPGVSALIALAAVRSGESGWTDLSGPWLAVVAWCTAAVGALVLMFAYEHLAWKKLRARPLTEQLLLGACSVAVVSAVAGLLVEPQLRPFPQLLDSEPTFVGGVVVTDLQMLVVGLGVVLLIAFWTLLPRLDHGRARLPKAIILAGLLGATGGISWAMNYGVTGTSSIHLQAPPLAAFLLGGGVNVARVAAASVMLGIVESAFATFLGPATAGLLSSQHAGLSTLFVLACAWPALRPQELRMTQVDEAAEPAGEADRTAVGAVIVLGVALFVLGDGGGQHLLRPLAWSMPWLVITVGLYAAVRRARVADLGYVIIPASGAYLFAFLRAEPFAGMFGFSASDGGVLASAWVSLGLAALLGALVASALHALAGRRSGIEFAILAWVLLEAVQILLYNLDSITNGPQGISDIAGFGDPGTATWAGWIALAGSVAAMVAIGTSRGDLRKRTYIAAGAIGGLAGALMAATLAYISPEPFSSQEMVRYLLVVLVGMRFGLGGVMAAALLVQLLGPTVPLEWQLPGLAVLAFVSAGATPWGGFRGGEPRAQPFGPNPYRI